MKLFLSVLVFVFVCKETWAQADREPQHTEETAIHITSNRLYGKLVDHNTSKGIEAASVQLYAAAKDSLIAGMLTKANGNFSFSNLVTGISYRLIISALGYETFEDTVLFAKADDKDNAGKFEKDLGNITLQPYVKQLTGVTVVAKRPALEMSIDRKVFNVAKSLTSTGGSAVDVMKNIPSVTVDIDGNVQLRNNTPQIFVDGRPTILTLDQIPADNIEKVELITNPSAKFDAATSGGIINVVLKKDKRIGLNGIVSASAGTPRIANGNLNLNLREGKLNFFISGGYNQSGGTAKGEANRENKENGVTKDYFNQYTSNKRFRRFKSLNIGADYFIDNRNTVSLTQSFGGGRFTNHEEQRQEYLTSEKVIDYYGYRSGNSRSRFNRNSTRINYKRTFPEEGREWTADINYNYGNSASNSAVFNTYLYPDGAVYMPPAAVRNDGRNNNHQVTFQTDYVNPVNDHTKFETGLRLYYNDFKSFFNVFSVDGSQETKLPLSNNYAYKELVNAGYVTFSQKAGTFSYQVGLRAEYSRFDGLMVDSAYKFGYEYPVAIKDIWDALFPSLFLTQQISENDQVQLNFSRRIIRPDFWQLNPFIEISDPVNLRQGNPQLKPEFVNSFELNYSKNYKSGNFLGVIFFRNNPKDITQYSDTITSAQYQQLQNAAVDPNAILNTFINASTTNRYGAEFTVQQKAGNNFDITPTVTMQYRTIKANVANVDLNNQGFNWEAKLIVNYKIRAEKTVFNNLSFQLMGEYESGQVIPQGRRLPQSGVDFAMRKDFLKNNKATVTFGINDVFNTQRWGSIYDTETFYQSSYRRWNVRNFRITFSYKFGKADFSLLNHNHKDNDD